MKKKINVPDEGQLVLHCEYLHEMCRYRVQHRIKIMHSIMTLDQYYSSKEDCVEYMQNYTQEQAAFFLIHIRALLTQMNTKSRT